MRIGLPQFVERHTTLWMDVGVSLTLEASGIKLSMIRILCMDANQHFLQTCRKSPACAYFCLNLGTNQNPLPKTRHSLLFGCKIIRLLFRDKMHRNSSKISLT